MISSRPDTENKEKNNAGDIMLHDIIIEKFSKM